MFKSIPQCAALALALALPASATPVNDAGTALTRISEAGYHAPFELEYRHGYWVAETTTSDGLRITALVDPDTGDVAAFDARGNGAISSSQVRAQVLAAGYVRVKDIEFDDGFWEVEAIDRFGREIDLIVHPISGAILNAPDDQGATPLTAVQIHALLTEAGYTRIHDLEYDDDGYWEADATNPRGERVELRIDPYTGAVLREKLDD